jgi:hypothetical protein
MYHSFLESIATQYGIFPAIILQDFWTTIRGKISRQEHYFEVPNHPEVMRHWCYDTITSIQQRHPYLSAKQVRTAIDKLIEVGVLAKGNFNPNTHDRTSWYCILDENITLALMGKAESKSANATALQENSICPTGQMEVPQGANVTTYNYNNPIINPILDISQPAVVTPAKAKGSIFNIKDSITKEQYQAILIDPTLCDNDRPYLYECAREMEDWSKAGLKKKIDWAAALRNWVRGNRRKGNGPNAHSKAASGSKTFKQLDEEREALEWAQTQARMKEKFGEK